MEYEFKYYYRVKYALACARQSFLKEPPKDDYEEYARRVIGRAYFIILNKINELVGINARLLKHYKENVEKYKKLCYNKLRKAVCRFMEIYKFEFSSFMNIIFALAAIGMLVLTAFVVKFIVRQMKNELKKRVEIFL